MQIGLPAADPFWNRVQELAVVDLEILKALNVTVEKTDDIAKEWVNNIREIFIRTHDYFIPMPTQLCRTKLLKMAAKVVKAYFLVVKEYGIAPVGSDELIKTFYEKMSAYLKATRELSQARKVLEIKVSEIIVEYIDSLFKELPDVLEILKNPENVFKGSRSDNQLNDAIKSFHQIKKDALVHLNPILEEAEVIEFSEIAKNYNVTFKLEPRQCILINVNGVLRDIFQIKVQNYIKILETTLSGKQKE